jgi:hypothetical protein
MSSILTDNASQNGPLLLASDKTGEKMKLLYVSSALLLASGIGITEAISLFFGYGILLRLMDVSPLSLYILVDLMP